MRLLPLALLCIALCGQQVSTRDGNIYFTGADGQRLQLTGEFRDLFPALSPDARKVAFVRITTPEGFGEETTELCVVDVGPGEPPPTCAPVVYQEGEDPLGGFHDPAWSSDGRNVYFLSDFSRSAAGFCRFDATSGRAAFLAPANRFAMLKGGQWRGLPVVAVQAGDTFPYFVLSAQGEQVARAGEPNETLAEVVARLERE